jgi:hypothetical protein
MFKLAEQSFDLSSERNFGGVEAGWKVAKVKPAKFIVYCTLIRISGNFAPPPKEVNSPLRSFVK